MQKSFKIKSVKPEHYPQLKALWLMCFPDEEEQVLANFFEKTVTPENVIATFFGEQIINATYLLESEITIKGVSYSALYIYGVCTHPEYRGKGLMKTAFKHLEESATSKCVDYLFLVPATASLFDMYKKLGYKTGFTYEKTIIDFDEMFSSEVRNETFTFEKYLELRKNNCSDISGHATLKEKAFNSFYLPVGEEIRVVCSNKGYCVFSVENKKITVYEYFCENGFKLPCSGDCNNNYSVELRKPSLNGKGIPFGMYKVFGNAPELKNAFFGVPYGG